MGKFMRKIVLIFGFFLFIFSVTHGIFCKDLEVEWKKMQAVYINLSVSFSQDIHGLQQKYVFSEWKRYQETIGQVIMGKPNECILLSDTLLATMVRQGFSQSQQIELNYLDYFLSPKNKSLLSKFADLSFGGISLDCPERNYSVNTLGQLFYFAKIIEQKDYESIGSIVEFGSGYGCLCRIAKTLLPNTTYIMIDLPEFLAIQSFYLNMTLDNTEIIVHHTVPQSYKSGAIHLVPVFLLEDLNITADVFVSPFALSECSSAIQRLVIAKKFFNASLCYITGQINGGGTPELPGPFNDQTTIVEGIKNVYTYNYYHPFHGFSGGKNCNYEIVGIT